MTSVRGTLLGAASIAVCGAASAVAQDDVQDEIVVTGIRGSLQQSLDVKRNAEQIVDAVSAEDVGKFPDTNVAEALQRITGVAIDRAGGEGQFITVRGLGPEFNYVLLNGRTIATDNDGREFSFDVLSSDIIQRAEVFKTSTPNLQSGGIGSVVNVVTARPFDRPGVSFTASAAGLYDTLREEFSPQFSGVGSWTNDSTTLGATIGVAYSNRRAQVDRAFTNGFALRDGAVNPGDIIVDAPESSVGLDASAVVPAPTSRVQQQVVFSRDEQDRERITINGAAQARPVENLTITLDGLWSRFDIDSSATEFSGFFSPPFIDPVLDENGTAVSFSRPSVDFANRNPDIAGLVGLSQNDNVLTSNSRLAETYQFGLNLDYQATETLNLHFDASVSRATRDETNPFVVLGALAPTSPLIQLPGDEGISTITNLSGLTDVSIQRLHFVNVRREDLEDDVFELRAGGDWEVDAGPLRTVSFGGLYTDRRKTFNLFDNFADPTSSILAGQIFCAFCGYTVPFDTSILSEFSFDGFLDGVPGAETVPETILTASFEDAFAELNDPANLSNPDRTGGNTEALLAFAQNPDLDPVFGIFTPTFNPAGSFDVEEDVAAAYFNTQWEGDWGGLPWSANVGFRVAITETLSTGIQQPVLEFRETPGDTVLVTILGPQQAVSVENRYVNILPSENYRIEPTEDIVLRLAYSETLTRPTLTELGTNQEFGGRSDAPTSTGGNPFLEAFESENYDVSFEWYIDDVSYFSVAGFHKEFENFLESQTLPIVNPIVFPAGNDGRLMDEVVDVTFQDTRSRNGETGSITGVEVAFQRSFTELPAPFDGLGTVINYTYVTSSIDREEGTAVADCDFTGLSPHSFNVTGFYEKGPLSGRLSYNYRDEFLFQCFSFFSEPQEREAFGQLDFSASFDVSDNFQIFAEGINILSAERRDFSRFRNRFLELEDTGSRFLLGVRANF
ncbi:MAG: TonB-dependent receptor [Parvularculaceae bacterium]